MMMLGQQYFLTESRILFVKQKNENKLRKLKEKRIHK